MSKLRPAKPREVVRVLERLGFHFVRQSRGSHAVYHHADGRTVVVPEHPGKDVSKGTLRKIIREASISVEKFEELR